MYTGREYDRGLKLYYNRARYYDPKLARFISRDPIDIADDVNLYTDECTFFENIKRYFLIINFYFRVF
jgi:hypothetical protein